MSLTLKLQVVKCAESSLERFFRALIGLDQPSNSRMELAQYLGVPGFYFTFSMDIY